ncbi:MAG TPA: 3-oxoacyl-ACP reductase FabG, partial [Gammaproteobacteria bacterium]|nr:3-oxoacyl-ACP reductase FabG [Gammaproteobacteria bacterium]
RAEHVAASILEFGGSAESVCFDVTDAEASRKILENELADRPIQVIVNNAGIHDDAPLAGMSHEQWHRVVDVSLHGFYNVTQPLLLPMMRTRWGRVIAVSSVAAQLGNRGQANYAAAKAGLHGAIKSLSQELASRGITANIVAPGIIQGEMTDNTFDKETIKKMVPAQRAGKPEEVADLVAFLASDRAAYISGQVIGINGGIV